MKKFNIIIIFLIVFIVISVLIFNIFSKKVVSDAKTLTIKEINFNQIEDGEYLGNYKIFPVEVKVKVTIKDKEVINIELLEHFNGLGTPAEEVINQIIIKQSLQVDNITGATLSSIVIKKAVEDSFEK